MIAEYFRGQHSRDTVLGFLYAFVFLMTIFQILSLFAIPVTPTIGRVTYYTDFAFSFTGLQELDLSLIFIFSTIILWAIIANRYVRYTVFLLPLAIPFLFNDELRDWSIYAGLVLFPIITVLNIKIPKRILSVNTFQWRHFAIAFVIIITVVEVASFVTWILYGFVSTNIYEGPSWYFAHTSNNLFHILNLLSPFLVLLTVYSFVLLVIRQPILKLIAKIDLATEINKISWIRERVTANHDIFFIGLIASSAILPFYPYLAAVNPSGQLVGTDYPAYETKLETIDDENSLQSIFVEIPDRPGTIIILYYMKEAFMLDYASLFRIMPSILAPITVFVTYRTVLASETNKSVALISGYFVLFSYYILVSVYGGFLANWIVIIFMLACFYLLVREARKHSYFNYFGVVVVSVAAMFTHVYGWTYIIAILVVYTAVTYYYSRKTGNRNHISIILLGIIISGNIAGDFVKVQFIGTSSGVESDAELAESAISTEAFSQRYSNLKFMLTTYFGGFLSNPVMFILAILWTLKAKIERPLERLLLSSIYVAAPVFLISDFLLQSRLLFMMPLSIAASLITFELLRSKKPTGILIFLMIIAFLASNALRSLGNTVFVFPQ